MNGVSRVQNYDSDFEMKQNTCHISQIKSDNEKPIGNTIQDDRSVISTMDSEDSLDYIIEKLKGLLKLLIAQDTSDIHNLCGISEAEICEILGIENHELKRLRNILLHTEHFLDIIRNPAFLSLMNPEPEYRKEVRTK